MYEFEKLQSKVTENKMNWKLLKLREIMKNRSVIKEVLNAYIIPLCDQHQSEYIACCDRRLEYISGFTGSAGTGVVTENLALLFTDGRYFLQAEKELSEEWILMRQGLVGTPTIEAWLAKNLPPCSIVGVDPKLINAIESESLEHVLIYNGHKLGLVFPNLIDVIWFDKPTLPISEVFPLGVEITGQLWVDKIIEVRKYMHQNDVSLIILTALDEIAWLFNLRGADILYNPVFFAYCAITLNQTCLFIDEAKLTLSAQNSLCSNNDVCSSVIILPYDNLDNFIFEFLQTDEKSHIWISQYSSLWLHNLVPKNRCYKAISPIQLMKAIKNPTEIEGMKQCHIYDAIAVIRYLCWLQQSVSENHITELSGSAKLEEFRRYRFSVLIKKKKISVQPGYCGPSFETISAVGSNASIVHYRPSSLTNQKITTTELYLIDSGGQNGTTDITRTVHFGNPTNFERQCFTAVLKGSIALTNAIFPCKVQGHRLDAIARCYLWKMGLDYMHGTGHGVGHYLNVHEGPGMISWRMLSDDPGIYANMVFSNEPGYYEDGKFGIRIENLMVTVPATTSYHYKNVEFLTFDTITLVPIQKKMILENLLTFEEKKWLNEYHNKIFSIIGPYLIKQDTDAYSWLVEETKNFE